MGTEERLVAAGVNVEEVDFEREDEPDVAGCLIVRPTDGAMIAVRPGLTGEKRDTLMDWAESRLLRFSEHGPEPDGWQKRTDGDWQLWARGHVLPNPD